MKKLVILAAILTCFSFGFAKDWLPFDNSSNREPVVNVIESDNNRLLVEISLPGMFLEELNVNGQIFQRIELIEGLTTHEVGMPELPMITRIVGIPDDQLVQAQILSSTSTTLNGLNLFPLQTPEKDGKTNSGFVMDSDFYNSTEVFPEINSFVDNIGIWRDVKIGGFHFIPFRYTASGELEIITTAQIEIQFYGFDGEHILNKDKYLTPDFYRMYDSALLNFGTMGYQIRNTDEVTIKYLIVTNTSALASIQPFVDLKNQQGFPVEVRTLEAGFETAIQIKDYITQLYNSDDLEYVLMVGDAYPNGSGGPDNVPMYLWSGGGESSWSDSWYSCMGGNTDYYADLAIGRITYDSMAELDHQIQKLMDFYTIPDQTTNWGENSILVAHSEQYPLKYTQCKQQIMDYPYALQIPIFTPCYGGAGATNADIINWVNTTSGGVFNYRGHGSATELWQWGASGSFTATHVNQLTNDNRNFVMFDVCCDNMDIVTHNGNCLAESFMKADEAAIAINGAINPSYTIPNHDYDKEMYKALFNEGILNIGYITNYANVFVVNLHGNIGIANVLTYLWLGDSSIEPWTKQIEDLTVLHDQQLFLGIVTFDVQVQGISGPLENARVCISNDEGTILGIAFTDATGFVQVEFDEPVITPGTGYVNVSAHNYLDYNDDIPIIPMQGPYIIFESYEIDDTTLGNGNGELNNSESVYLNMSLENIGNDTGTNVVAMIETADPYITIIDGMENFGDIAANTIATLAGAFTIEAAGDIPDSHIVYFDLIVVAEDTWTSYFNLMALAPMFPPQNLSHEIQNINDIVLSWDAPAGSDNSRDLLGYKVYRDEEEIAEIDDPATLSYTDVVLVADEYEYFITALFHVGESEPSNVELVDFTYPTPQNPAAVTQGMDILVTWEAPAFRDFTHYKVYRNLAMIADNVMETSYLDPEVPNGTYSYNVRAVYTGGYQSALSTNAVIEHVQTNAGGELIPMTTELEGNYPNPFNPNTSIRFALSEDGHVCLEIYNIKGEKVRTLIDSELKAQYHNVQWNGEDSSNKPVASGIYFYRLQTGNYSAMKKMILMK